MPAEGPPCKDCGTRLGKRTATRPQRPIRIESRCFQCHDLANGGQSSEPATDSKPLEASPCVECRTTGGYTPPDSSRPARSKGRCQKCASRFNKRLAVQRRGEAANATRRNIVTNTKPDKPKELDPPEDDEVYVAGSVGDSVREYQAIWKRREWGRSCSITTRQSIL